MTAAETGHLVISTLHTIGAANTIDRIIDSFPPEQFIGRALVIDCRELAEGDAITLGHIRKYGELAETADFLLFYTGWDARWGTDAYFGDYPCLDMEAIIKGSGLT